MKSTRSCLSYRRVGLGKTISLAIFVVTSVSSVAAEGAYRWLDADGSVHYGSTPPPSARDVTSLQAKKFSRYSSDKLLRPYAHRAAAASSSGTAAGEAVLPPVNLSSKDSRSPAPSGSKSLDAEKDASQAGSARARLKNGKSPTTLQAESPNFAVNDEGDVIRCQVLVKNKSKEIARGVSVRFEFADGSLIPAVGAFEIPPEGQATYVVPEEVLPIRLAGLRADRGQAEPEEEDFDDFREEGAEGLAKPTQAVPPPKVVIRVGSDS